MNPRLAPLTPLTVLPLASRSAPSTPALFHRAQRLPSLPTVTGKSLPSPVLGSGPESPENATLWQCPGGRHDHDQPGAEPEVVVLALCAGQRVGVREGAARGAGGPGARGRVGASWLG